MEIKEKISLIIPAYNESKNISRVLGVTTRIGWLSEIIIVNDGSTDRTAKVAEKFSSSRIKLVNHQRNLGKGAALATGIEKAKHNLLVFLDADLIGLKRSHVARLIKPIIFTKEADLTLGIFGRQKIDRTKKIVGTIIANRAFPQITGQRAVWRRSLPPVKEIRKSGFGVDILMTRNVPKRRRRIVELAGLSQVIKEEKEHDFGQAFKSRLKMYQEIIKSGVK